MVYPLENDFPNPNGRIGFGSGWPPWWWVDYQSVPTPSATAVARYVDSLLVPLLPTERTVRLLDEFETLAVVDAGVQRVCELLAAELQPCFDDDEDGVLAQLLWANLQELMASPLVRAGTRRMMRSGPALVTYCQFELRGRMRADVLRSARDEVRNRRRNDPALDERLRIAADELAVAIPKQVAPIVVGGALVAGTIAVAWLADVIYESHTGHHISEHFHR